MSRCFPYPPPGYSRNGATYEALIESIKLQKENDKAKTERKKEKRAKKEKKEKKEKQKSEDKKSKLQNNPNSSQQDSHHKELQTSSHFKEQSLQLNIKRKEPVNEQLERSDLTEEHGQPVDSHKPSYSSDSTQNSNKRKRDDPVEPDDSNHVKPIKIRLLKKQKVPEASCSDSGRTGQQSQDSRFNGQKAPVLSQSKKSDVALLQSSRRQPIPSYSRPAEHVIPTPLPILPPVSSVSRKNDARKNDTEMVSSSGRRSTIDEIKAPKKVGPTRFEKKLMKKHLKYEKLIGGWVAPVVEAPVVGDDDWLLGSGKRRDARSAMVDDVEMCREVGGNGMSLWQPCGRFLVEGDVYALPYTVPY